MGPWLVDQQDSITLQIKKDGKGQTVHVNRVRPLLETEEVTVECIRLSPP